MPTAVQDERWAHIQMRVIASALVPFISQWEGEEAAPDNLVIHTPAPGRHRLFYKDEDLRDRDSSVEAHAPVPAADDDAGLRSQACTEPARTGLGFLCLAGPRDYGAPILVLHHVENPTCQG